MNRFHPLFVLSLFFIGKIFCSSIDRPTNYKLVIDNPDLVIYAIPPNDKKEHTKEKNLFFSSEFLQYFFSGLQKEKQFKSLVQDSFFIRRETAKEITEELIKLFQSEEGNNIFYVIVKRSDPIAPATRLYRTRFYISLEKNSLYFQILELDQNMIFGDQYRFLDWAAPDFPKVPCEPLRMIDFTPSYSKKVLFIEDANCVSQSDFVTRRSGPINYHRFHLFLQDLPEKEISKSNPLSLTEKLQELENMKKRNLITEKEYQQKRKKILDSL